MDEETRAEIRQVVRPTLVGKKLAAYLLSVSPRTVNILIQKGELPVREIGSQILIPYSAIVQFASVVVNERKKAK